MKKSELKEIISHKFKDVHIRDEKIAQLEHRIENLVTYIDNVLIKRKSDDSKNKVYKMEHDCKEKITKYSGFGPAIEFIYKDDYDKWHVSNGEYGTEILFCPWCGEKLDDKISSKT